MKVLQDRLDVIRRKMKGARIYYSRPNPRSDYMMDVEDAEEDILWMVYEIERLRELTGEGAGSNREAD